MKLIQKNISMIAFLLILVFLSGCGRTITMPDIWMVSYVEIQDEINENQEHKIYSETQEMEAIIELIKASKVVDPPKLKNMKEAEEFYRDNPITKLIMLKDGKYTAASFAYFKDGLLYSMDKMQFAKISEEIEKYF